MKKALLEYGEKYKIKNNPNPVEYLGIVKGSYSGDDIFCFRDVKTNNQIRIYKSGLHLIERKC